MLMEHQNESEQELIGTPKFIARIISLGLGQLNLFRSQKYKPINASVESFDLFSGIWWNLRQNNQWTPPREVSWLIAKLYAQYPTRHKPRAYFAIQFRNALFNLDKSNWRKQRLTFDSLLTAELDSIEPYLVWALSIMHQHFRKTEKIPLDWVQLTDDLSNWNKDKTKIEWSNQFLNINKGDSKC